MAVSYPAADVDIRTLPMVVLRQELVRPCSTWVSSGRDIVAETYELGADFVVVKDV